MCLQIINNVLKPIQDFLPLFCSALRELLCHKQNFEYFKLRNSHFNFTEFFLRILRFTLNTTFRGISTSLL